MCFQKIHRLKKDSDLQRRSKKSYSRFIKILQAKCHFDYLIGRKVPFCDLSNAVCQIIVELFALIAQ